MRKLNQLARIILLLLICFSVSAKSNTEIRLKNMYYSNSLGEKGVTHFYYSLENKNFKAIWELIDGTRHSINYHFLDKNDNLIRKYREFSDSITSNNFYKYDNQGNLVEDYFERSDGVKGIVWYNYENGKKTEAICRGLNGWFYGIIKYQYSNELLTKGIIYKDGQEAGFIEYKYDNKHNLITEYWDFGGKWNQTFTYEYENISEIKPEFYTYSSPFLNPTKEYIIQEENYSWNNEQGGPSYYEYDGNKLVRKVYKYDSLETITTYEYDEKGLLMKSFRNYSDGRKAEFSYHYNTNNQLIRRLFFASNGFEGSESYEYNENGTLKLAIWDKFDTWLTGTLTFTYNSNNRINTGIFKGANNFDADLLFETDNKGNLTKIHWDFSFGKTQTYWFKYKNL